MPPQDTLAEATTFLEALIAWAAQALPNLLAALALMLFGLWFAGWAARTVGRIADRERRFDPTLKGVLTSLVRYTIVVIFFIAVLGQLGIQTTSILAALGAAGLAIGLALQGTLSNIAAGMMLLWLRPFRTGDYIDAGDVAGTVKEVGLFASELHSWDGVYQFVPNSQLWNKQLINYSRLPTRMVQVKYGIAYDDDIETGKATLLALAEADARIHADPAPIVFVSTLGDSAVELSLRAWVQNTDYWPTVRALNEEGKRALENAGLSIPFPQRDIHIYNSAPPENPPSA
ncbi:Small-conductance mechanosensitive channel [Candidatus Filomicrobium marinum]|uniref:Small-conductance mechanosensitive channel n=2 Tax=Filomicrobium TaxID=119044 RepID=A0A0D6JKV0_9HYPH|nr:MULTISPECIES: mechanosensitive ion channel family protein [Filomicrobium]MCV0371305.1 mechanosensitive ion channel family protein [Filomicrobium sp.]CFX57502.1 Small-conductance mechanosensitive channel [Candidatus Filomicrobium marinum]CPR22285.1 Small-conductance mechanosensitive channel [Candidatus Filomicrobium marinum]SDO89678.1 small conductance mechanosensitive channel [Filomicrobium insigne]